MRQPVNPLVYDKPGMVAADRLLAAVTWPYHAHCFLYTWVES